MAPMPISVVTTGILKFSANLTASAAAPEEMTPPPRQRQGGKTALKLKERYRAHIHTHEQPRFCVKYRDKSEHPDTVYLHVLPLEKEEDIHFSHGKFVDMEEIRASYPSFSPNLQVEYEFLGMAAELWNDFYSEF